MASIEPEERKLEVDSISPEQRPEILLPQNTETNSMSVKDENPSSVSEEPTMASREPVEIKLEGDSISPEQRPEILPPQNTEADSVSVKVENPGSDSEEPTENPSIQTTQRVIPKPLCYLIYCLIFVCLAPVAYAFITVVTVATLPLVVVTVVAVRLFQIIVRAENYEKRMIITDLLRNWTFMLLMLLLVEVGLFYPFAKYVPGLKLIMIIGLPITKWIKIICILIGIYYIGQFITLYILFILAHVISNEDDQVYFLSETISEIFGCLLVLWANAVVMSSVPIFKHSKIFGIYTQIWVKVSLFVLIGYNIITSLTHALVWLLPKIYAENTTSTFSSPCCGYFTKSTFNNKNLIYIAIGIKRSVIFILCMVMIIITWMVYFGNRLDTTPQNQSILNFGTWTFFSLLICSFLWLFKSCLLLYWKAHTVYDRLHPKIRDIGKQIYFLVMLSYEHYKQAARYSAIESNDPDCWLTSFFKAQSKKKVVWNLPDNSDENYTYQRLDRKIVRAEFIKYTGKKASIYDIHKAVQRFLTAQNALANENTVGDLQHLQCNDSEESNAKCVEILKEVVQVEGDFYFDEDWEMFLKLLPDVHTTEDITFQKVKTFMERAHSRCMFLTNTLISENEVVKCLNQVISGIIIAVTCIMWLLLTGLASTKVFVLIASPLLAATFIFGDTAKNLFQGLIFVYVVHPFDVGDLCFIDHELLEVKRIGIWSTIFSNIRAIGEQGQIIYPNSVLSLKNIINHKTNFNWSDRIEVLSSPDKKIIEPLKHKLEIYLRESEKFTPNFHSVEILEMGDKAKIAIHIRHNFQTTEGWTYFECLKEKEKRRFELAIYAQNLVKQLEFGTGTGAPAESAEIEDFYTRG